MMSNYESGDTLNECLNKVIKERNAKTIYPEVDDRIVLGTYVLFTEELTKWMIFGAYDFIRENKLQKNILEICSTVMPLQTSQLEERFEQYVKSLEEDKISDEQIEMLEMLGFSIKRKIDEKDIKEAAISEKAMDAFSGSLLHLKAFTQKIEKGENIKE